MPFYSFEPPCGFIDTPASLKPPRLAHRMSALAVQADPSPQPSTRCKQDRGNYREAQDDTRQSTHLSLMRA